MHGLEEKSIFSKWDKNSEQKHFKKGGKNNIVSINIGINPKKLLKAVTKQNWFWLA